MKLSIVTFNYDRSLEYFLYNAFMKSFRLDSGQAIKLTKCIPVIHVYSELGLPRFLSKEGRDYAITVTTEDIRKCIEGIKIMPEAEETHSGFNQVHQILSEAKKLIIIGFSFHSLSVQRLKLAELYKGKVIGTVMGMELGEISRVQKTLHQFSITDTELYQLDALNFLRKTDYFLASSLLAYTAPRTRFQSVNGCSPRPYSPLQYKLNS